MIAKVLDAYESEIERVFGDGLIGIYLTGSAALGGFHEGKSDIDCTVLLKSSPDETQIEELNCIHRDMARRFM